MSKARLLHVGLMVLFLLLLAGAVWAGNSANYALDWHVLSGGGGPASAGGVTLNGTLGQTAIGPSAGGGVTLGAGFWYGLGQGLYRVYLPVVLRD
jgi:hypothetical protein